MNDDSRLVLRDKLEMDVEFGQDESNRDFPHVKLKVQFKKIDVKNQVKRSRKRPYVAIKCIGEPNSLNLIEGHNGHPNYECHFVYLLERCVKVPVSMINLANNRILIQAVFNLANYLDALISQRAARYVNRSLALRTSIYTHNQSEDRNAEGNNISKI